MKDIVAELRGYGDCVTSEAADEIERLREFEVLVKHYQGRLRTIAKHPDTPEVIRQYAVGLLDTDGTPAEPPPPEDDLGLRKQ